MKKTTKRSILYFILALFTIFILLIIFDWDSFKTGFEAGWSDATIEKSE